ncbi:alpha/beta hydrolase [Actinokineospora sp. HUAS TT18]|uniref:alpha/beta hydrolase n=1 Tax=Actinokineospora sp. HUAS TT18 TaxID=3447451 RepID=UPI003F5212B8
MRTVSRRGLLVGGLGLLAAAGCQDSATPTSAPPVTTDPAVLAQSGEPVTVVRALSYARGKDVRMVIYRPENAGTAALPVCLAMHGQGEDADAFAGMGITGALTEMVRAGGKPFALVALDGGTSSWTKAGADDPGRMLREEIPAWLTRQGLATTVFGSLGIGTGAYGALNYVTQPGVAVTALLDPTLFDDFAGARAGGGVATDEAWKAADPFRQLDQISQVAVGIWSGEPDATASRLAGAVKAEKVDIGSGAGGFRQRKLPEVLTFLGSQGIRIAGGY